MANELILIVEDNPKNLKLVRDSLQVKGYQTIEVETGEGGIRVARERHPALVLMDIQLPGISGIEAFQQLRADPTTRAIPVIAVTASVMAQDRKRIMATASRESRSVSRNCWRPCGRSLIDHEVGCLPGNSREPGLIQDGYGGRAHVPPSLLQRANEVI